jgi:hypothetical protein
MRSLLLMLALASVVFLADCGSSSSPTSTSTSTGGGGTGGTVVLQSITINPGSASIAQGTTQAFTATGNYSDGSTKDLTATAQWRIGGHGGNQCIFGKCFQRCGINHHLRDRFFSGRYSGHDDDWIPESTAVHRNRYLQRYVHTGRDQPGKLVILAIRTIHQHF